MSARPAPDPAEQPAADPAAPTSGPSGTTGHRHRHRGWWVAALVSVIVVVSAVGLASWRGRSAEATTADQALPTATVQRGTLTASETRDATIDYADTSTLSTDVAGRVTWLPTTGKRIARGRTLARVDEARLVSMYGKVPAYRTMSTGDTGRDVKQLEANLAALGYSGFTADSTFTSSTATAVRAWQGDTGLPETGSVPMGQVAFLPKAVQVGAMVAAVGDRVSPGAPLYEISTRGRVVSATLSEQDRDLAVVGAPVTIDAGSAGGAQGTITRVDAVASTSSQGNQTSTSTNYVATIVLDPASEGAGGLTAQADGSPVTVEFAATTAQDVLWVPVKALLALAEGGYGVEVVNSDSTTAIIAVTTGLYANGRVEVSADGLAEGTTVRTAR